MPPIVLRPELLDALERNADLQTTSLNDLVNEAVARFVMDLQLDKLTGEIQSYERMHAELKRTHLGQWVAIHEGKLVDQDADRAELYRSIRQRFGRTTVLIRQVGELPGEDIRWRGGSLHSLPS